MSRVVFVTCLAVCATASAVGTDLQQETAEPPLITDVSQVSAGSSQDAARFEQENAELRKQQQTALGRTRRYQWLTLGGLLLASFLSFVLYVSRDRLRRANLQLKEQIESNARSQEVQEELAARVTQSERMESLGALAGGIAHDFNNLLVGVVCNAEVLQMYHEHTPDSEKCLNGILKAAETACDLSRKMLAYAGRQPSEKRAVDINELVRPIVSLVQSGLVNSDIKFIPSDQPAVADVDTTQIEQIVLNLVQNANEALGDKKGTIRISVTEEHLVQSASDPYLLGKAVPSGDYVVIEVQDNGPGIPPEDLGRIFEPFQSSHTEVGRGLGLSVVYGHVNRHDGFVRVHSSVGKETTIRVLLPRSDHTVAPQPIALKARPLAPSGTLLFVDDEEIIRDVAARFMAQVQWKVVSCAGGREALEWIGQNRDQKPDCICLDVVMPETTGPQVLERLQELKYDVPVIVISGYSQSNLQKLLEYEYVTEFLPKPFNIQQLTFAVSRATQGRVLPDTTLTAASSQRSPLG